ncbi:MAG TPA: c-type cytochrome, partial [Verrucomicrobiae bacterium]|nr:c-type cytochrome [Verrucomicrobiae bacterium]
GQKCFNELGCAGCHTVRGQLVLTNETRLSLEQVSDKWQPRALAEYLRAPGRYFKWTRMPDFKLNQEEAEALSAFLFANSTPRAATTPGRSARTRAGRGRELVTSLGCLGCHAVSKEKNGAPAPTLGRLASSDWARGCLAEEPARRGRAPAFALTGIQRAALRSFGKQAVPAALTRDTPEDFAERQYTALRCQACHSRDQQTDLLTELAAAAPDKSNAATDDETGSRRSVHIGRPTLTLAGEKLYSGWMKQCLGGTLKYKPRPELQGRMPGFPAYAEGMAEGFAHEHGYPSAAAPAPRPEPQLVEIGRRLTGVAEGFSCVSCHGVGSQRALAGKDTATVNFACVAERLRPSYYWRYVQDPPHLLPGTMMPKFIGEDGKTQVKTIYDGDPQKQFNAIWNYLVSLRAESLER